MKAIFIKKAIILGSTLHKPGKELAVPEDVSEKEANGLVKAGFACDASAKEPAPEKAAAVVASIEAAKTAPEVEKAVESVEKPTAGILDAAAVKVKGFAARMPKGKPGSRMGRG